jgi:hypothetical protein
VVQVVPLHVTVIGNVQADAVAAVKARTTATTILLLTRDINVPPSSGDNLFPEDPILLPETGIA